MGILDKIAKGLRYPQSAMTGVIGSGFEGTITSPKGQTTKYSPLKEGLKGNLTPGKLIALNDRNVTIGNRISNSALDIVFDPVNLLMGAGIFSKGAKAGIGHLDEAGKAASILKELARGANSVGKIQDASVLARLGQGGRYLYQGTAAAEEGASGILSAAMLAAGLEKGAAKAISRLGTKAASDIVGQGAEEALSKTGLDKLSELVETRPNSAIARKIIEANLAGTAPIPSPGKIRLALPAPKQAALSPSSNPVLKALEGPKLPKELTETAGGPIIMGPGDDPIPVATLIKAIKNLDSGTYRSANPSKVIAKAAPAPVEKAVPVAKKAPAAKKPVAKKAATTKTAEKPKPKPRMIVAKPKAKITDAEALALLQAIVEKG